MNLNTQDILFLITPLIIGGIIAAFNANSMNNTTERAEAWTRQTQIDFSKKDGWFYKFILNPVFLSVVKFSDWTDSFTHRGFKNGVRVAAALYLIIVWCIIFYAVFMIAVAIIIIGAILYIAVKFFANSNEDVKKGFEKGRSVFQNSKQNNESITKYSGVRGQKIYSGTNWFNEDLKGRVDEDGNIYSGTNWLNEEKIGRIGEDGNIYKGTNWLNEEKTGRVDSNGNLHSGTNWFNEEKVGRIDKDGNIHKGTNWFNEEKTGRTGE